MNAQARWLLGLSAALAGGLVLALRRPQEIALPATPPGRWFSWRELTASTTAQRLRLDNTPPPQAQHALRTLTSHVLDPLRESLGRPVRVTSGYRSPVVNHLVGGDLHSQHRRGEAVDLLVEGLSARQLAAHLLELELPFDQLIAYAPERGGHVHVSLTARRPNRGEVLWASASGGFVDMGATVL